MRAVIEFFEKYNISGTTVFAAVSGGADSMCLINALLSVKDRFSLDIKALHFNHCIRGDAADEDEKFVKNACEKLGVELICGRGDAPEFSKENSVGIEEGARILRYRFFEDAVKGCLNCFIATAHNANDNAETVIMNLARGAGSRGLGGIPPVRGRYIRPLLKVSRAEIEKYNAKRNIKSVFDETNDIDEYKRNFVRHNIIPAMNKVNAGAVNNILTASETLREDEEFLQLQAEKFISENISDGRAERNALLSLHPAVSSRVLQRMCPGIDYRQIKSVLKLCAKTGENGKIDLPGIRLSADFNYLYFGDSTGCDFETGVAGDGIYETPDYVFTVKTAKFCGENEKSFTKLVFKYCKDCDKIIVRSRKTGDKIKLGEKIGTKSLKKLFIEKKIPASERVSVPVVCFGGELAGVLGVGTDVKFQAQPGDKIYIFDFREKKI